MKIDPYCQRQRCKPTDCFFLNIMPLALICRWLLC